MPSRAYQLTGDTPGLAVAAPALFQAEQEYFATQQRNKSRALERQQLDYKTGALAYKAYEESLKADLATINPDNPVYDDVYARLLMVKQEREDLQDRDILDKFERGVVGFQDVDNYFKNRLSETAQESPEWFGLTGSSRASFILNLQRNAERLSSQFADGEIGVGDYVNGLRDVVSTGGFVENSPVAVGLASKISSAKLQAELDSLSEEFEFAQGSDLLPLVDKLNGIKQKFSMGSDVRRTVFQAGQNILQTAYGQFNQQESRSIGDIFGRASSLAGVANEYGTFDQATKAQEALFGLSKQRADNPALSLKEFATNRPSLSNRLAPYQTKFSEIQGYAPSFDSIREAQKEEERGTVKMGSLLKAFEGF